MEAKSAATFIGADYYGPNDCFILNEDLQNRSINSKEATQFILNLFKMLKAAPKKKFFGIMFLAGHGMIHEGSQRILLNQYDNKREFYKLFQIEKEIRNITMRFKNSYIVAVAACCREIYIPERHSGCVKASSVIEAEEIF